MFRCSRVLRSAAVHPGWKRSSTNHARGALATLASDSSSSGSNQSYLTFLVASAAPLAAVASWTSCEKSREEVSPASVGGKEALEEITSGKLHNVEDLPEYSSDEVALNNGTDGHPIWMTYGGVVYDVTSFIPNHPGGDEKILMAAGSVRSRT